LLEVQWLLHLSGFLRHVSFIYAIHLKCNADYIVMTSFAKSPSPHTHPRDINKEKFRPILILRRFVNLLPEPLVVVQHHLMHFMQAFNGSSFNTGAGWFFLMT
jgi:predicted NodU family carbamoyl transferase